MKSITVNMMESFHLLKLLEKYKMTKTTDDKVEFGDRKLTNSLKAFLFSQSSLIKAVTSQNLDQRADEVKVVLASSCGTAMAISKLCDDSEYFYSDAVMLARSFIEKVINYCYLQVCEEEEFNNFIKHTIQKSYRRLYRSIKVGDRSLGVKLEQKIDTDSDPVLKDSLEAFTSKRGARNNSLD